MTTTKANRAKHDIRQPYLAVSINTLPGMRSRALRLLAAGLLAAAAAVLAPLSGFAAPTAPNGILEYDGRTALIVQVGTFDLLAQAEGRLENADSAFRYRSITLGGYWRVIRNLKVGAFYVLQAGARHDDDWVDSPTGWAWQDTTGRYENLLMLDASPRFLLDFLPGRTWVLLVKGRYVFDTFNLQHSLIARPQLTFFWLRDRDPFLDFTLSWEAWFPLNYGTTTIWENYPYLSVGYHITPEVMIELAGAYKTTIWSTSQDAIQQAMPAYQVPYSRWVLSAGVVFTLSP